MPSLKNIHQISNLDQDLIQAQAIYLVDYSGMTTGSLNHLRNQIKTVNSKLIIAKNTLFNLAVRKLSQSSPVSIKTNQNLNLTGNLAVIIAYQDQVQPLKIVVKFAKENEKPMIKFGLFNNQILDAKQVEQLSKLPGQDQLRAQLLGTLQAPLARLVFGLKGNITKLAVVLNEIKQQKN